MPFHLFTDLRTIVQDIDSAFGPVNNFQTTKYRVTSRFRITQTQTAYAVCSGTVFIQPVFGFTDMVNLILQPTQHPDNKFHPVAYFIYRGLKRADFVNANNEILPEANANNSDLIKNVWRDFNSIKNNYPTIVYPNTKRIGLLLHNDITDLPGAEAITLDQVFYQNAMDATTIGNFIQFTNVLAGNTLGNFEFFGNTQKDTKGFEVVLKDKLYTPTLKTARVFENVIEASAPDPSEEGGVMPIQKRFEREKILAFVDPAAYYATFQGVGIRDKSRQLKYNTLTEIYDNVISKFHTKSRIYIDIRNENGYSINYYQDNSTTAKKNARITVNNNAAAEVNFYTNFWPIYILDLGTPVLNNIIQFQFRTEYNRVPLLFLEYAFIESNTNSVKLAVDRTRFTYNPLDSAFAVNNWDTPHKVCIVQHQAGGGFVKSAFIVKCYLFKRKYDPALSMPPTTLSNENYLDNLFGPVNRLPLLFTQESAANHIKAEVGYDIRYVNATKEIGIECVVESSISRSENNLIFKLTPIAFDVDYLLENIDTLSPPGVYKGDSSFNHLKAEYLAQVDEERERIRMMFPAQVLNSYLAPFNGEVGEFRLMIPTQVYNTRILPALGTSGHAYHDVYFNLDTLSPREAYAGNLKKRVFNCMLKLSFINDLGTFEKVIPVGGNVEVTTTDMYEFMTVGFLDGQPMKDYDNSEAYVSFNDFISFVKTVEQEYNTVTGGSIPSDLDPLENNQAVKNTATRIRVHSYGFSRKLKSTLKYRVMDNYASLALETAIHKANYVWFTVGSGPRSVEFRRNLERPDNDEELRKAIKRLTGNADENNFKDNPSPYIGIPRYTNSIVDNVDMGQILYGLEALIIPTMSNPETGSGYHAYNITKPFILAAYIANIATPAAETLFHLRNSTAPDSLKALRAPFTADLASYYEVSAPEADLLGNADALGLSKAYSRLKNNSGLTLSNVLELYYLGLTNNLDLNGSTEEFYTLRYRWIITALYFKIVEKTATDTFKWIPDYPAIWNTPAYKGALVNEMKTFALFWHNRILHPKSTGLRISKEWIWINYDREDSFGADDPLINTYLDQLLSNHFLPFLRNRISMEHPYVTIV